MAIVPLLNRASVRAIDRALIDAGVPGVLLMENAGRGAAEIIAARAMGKGAGRAVVLAGPGNNGGDAYVAARHLRVLAPELEVTVISSCDPARVRGDAAIMRDAWLATGAAIVLAEVDVTRTSDALRCADVVVDGLFGTGLDRPLQGISLALVSAANERRPALAVALDLPSGLDADTGASWGDEAGVFSAHLTLTFAASKPGLHTGIGRRLAGETLVVGLGVAIPASLLASSTVLHQHKAATPRAVDAHKGVAGHVLVVGGSQGKTGAALLAARGAHRGGAGLVTIASRAAGSFAGVVLETMCAELPMDQGKLPAALDEAMKRAGAIVLGPGLGLDAWARQVVEQVVSNTRLPLVVDADGLRAIASIYGKTTLRRAGTVVLTPHPLEMAILLGRSGGAAEVNGNRLASARQAADRYGAIVVLKGAGTIVAEPGGTASIAQFANPVLAVAGSGDVLGGVIGARLAEGSVTALDAVLEAVDAHGCAGEAVARARGAVRGALASEIADAVSAALEAD